MNSGGIKHYQLTKGEEMPDEFCVVRDVDGEPSEYMFYVPESENAKLREQGARLFDKALELGTENDRLRELLAELYEEQCDECDRWKYRDRMRELGIEVE